MRPREREQGADAPPGLKGGGPHVGMAQRQRRWFRAPARCRSETGAPASRHPALRGPRREGGHPDGWGLCRRGPAGRCADQRSAFQAVPALFCCLLLLGFAALRAAVGRHPGPWGSAPRGEPSHSWGLNRRGPAGRCADQRSAFQAVPALFLYLLLLGFALPRDAGQRPVASSPGGGPLTRVTPGRGRSGGERRPATRGCGTGGTAT